MNFSESIQVNERQLEELQRLVRTGEGPHLEFKRKAAQPDKVIREILAFANSSGGTLLIGVDDDGSLPGVRYPEEEMQVIQESLKKFCRPAIDFEETVIPLSKKKFVVSYSIPSSKRKPHLFVADPEHKYCYVRVRDMSIKASREVREIVRRSQKKKDIQFTFGDAEKALMEYLEVNQAVTLTEFRRIARLKKFIAARKLILLVLANVLRVEPTEKEDLYFRV